MSQRRTLILVVAIAIGALASFLVWNYVNNVKDTAFNNAEQVPVYLVKQAVPRGTPGLEAQAYITKENIPRKFKPGNAITALEDISGKIAVGDLVPNQVVVSDMFVDASDPSAISTFAEKLRRIRNQDQTAITISVDQVHGVAGLVQPGDYVNILIKPVVPGLDDVTSGPSASTAENDGAGSVGARYLYQKVEVLAVGKDALPQAGSATTTPDAAATAEAADSGLITLIVPTEAAQYIVSMDPATIYLVLVARDYKPVPLPPLTKTPATPGEDSAKVTPYGPKGPESGA